MAGPFQLQLPYPLHAEMLEQAKAELPNECCGLLAGVLEGIPCKTQVGRVARRFPLVNTAASPREFMADPKGIFEAIREIRKGGLEVLAIYHSHPTSEPVPSKTDLKRNFWPGVMALIISLKGLEPVMAGWWLAEEDFEEAKWELVPQAVAQKTKTNS